MGFLRLLHEFAPHPLSPTKKKTTKNCEMLLFIYLFLEINCKTNAGCSKHDASEN